MARIAAVSSECFFVNRNPRRGILMDKKAASTFLNILKDCFMMSMVIMAGAALTFLLG